MEVFNWPEVPEDEDSLFFDLLFSLDGTYSCKKVSQVVHPSLYEPRWLANNFSSLEPLFSRVNSRHHNERERALQ
jgi:hypothetical protein